MSLSFRNVRIIESKISAWVPLEELKSMLSAKACNGGYVGLANNLSMRRIQDESTKRVLHGRRTDVQECRVSTTDCIFVVPANVLDDGSFIGYFVQLQQTFQDMCLLTARRKW